MEKLLWDTKKYNYKSVNEDKECDVLIVGGGITGVSLAYYLKDYNEKVILIERNKIGGATTMRSTAKLTHLQQDIALKIYKSYGFYKSKEYIDAQVDATFEIVNIIKKNHIRCNLEKNTSFLYINSKKYVNKLRDLYELYDKFGYKPYYYKIPNVNCYLSFAVDNSYVFHPLLYINGLLSCLKNSNVSIYEKTSMINYFKINNKFVVMLDNGYKITCKHLVFANHYLPFVFPYLLPFRNYLETSNVTVSKSNNLFYNAINLDKDDESIRFFKDYKINVSNSKKLSNNSILYNKDFSWNNYDLMTFHGLPLIGRIRRDENIYIASGFNTWGMTNSNIAARIISSLIVNKENELCKVFNSRYKFSLYAFIRFIKYNIIQIVNYISSYFKRSDEAKIIYVDGKRCGVYIDKSGKKHTVSITCPHMKCSLQFNNVKKTWDCPCHGSEFDVDGNLLRGPSVKCIKKSISNE